MPCQSNPNRRCTAVVPSLSDLVRDEFVRIDVRHEPGTRQALATRKITEGSVRILGWLEDGMTDRWAAGATWDQVTPLRLKIDHWFRLRWGRYAGLADYRHALLNEQRAQSAVDPLQMGAADLAHTPDEVLEALLPRLDWQRETTEAYALAVECELHRRSMARLSGRVLGRAA